MPVSSLAPQERLKLDLYDKKLIFLLSQDMRTPLKTLAKKLRIAEPRTHYKIERLKKELLSPTVILNYPLLQIPSYLVFIKRLDDQQAKRILDADETYYFFQTTGEAQYILIALTDDLEAFCTNYLNESTFTVQPICQFIPDNYNPFKLDLDVLPSKNDVLHKLDNKDFKLLRAIVDNPIAPITDYAQSCGIDRQTAKQRLQKLISTDIIKKFRYGINIFRLGMLVYVLRINTSPQGKKKLLPVLRADPYAGFIYETYDGFVQFYMPPSHTELFTFMRTIEQREPTATVSSMQTTEFFKIQPTPQTAIDIFEKRAAALK